MVKYSSGKLKRWEKLSRSEQADLLFDLLSAFTLLRSLPEAATFITDLLTRDEVRFLSKRLRIAKLLLSDFTYQEIVGTLKVSHVTIAKVASWLKEKGEGFRSVVQQIPKRRKGKDPAEHSEWGRFKRSHAAAFWPELLIEDLEEKSIKDENRGLRRTLDALGSKDVTHHRIEKDYQEALRWKKK